MWMVQVEEADQMSRAAQLALLSFLDSSANMTFDFGGAFRERAPLPVVWIFTANGTGYESTGIPSGFEARFVSRCLALRFEAKSTTKHLPAFLRRIWEAEGGNGQMDFGDFDQFEAIAGESQGSVRDALQALELRLLDCEFDADPADVEPEVEAEVIESSRTAARTSIPLFEQLKQDEESFWATR